MVGGAVMQNVDDTIMNYLPMYTKEELLRELDLSRMQAENGQVQDFDEALDEICRELDI